MLFLQLPGGFLSAIEIERVNLFENGGGNESCVARARAGESAKRKNTVMPALRREAKREAKVAEFSIQEQFRTTSVSCAERV